MNVGFWMIWEQGDEIGSILPVEGIGVYTCNVIRGILEADESAAVTVVCREKERAKMLKALPDSPRLRVINEHGQEPVYSTDEGEPEVPVAGVRSTAAKASRKAARAAKRAAGWALRKYRGVKQPKRLYEFLRIRFGNKAGKAMFLSVSPLVAAHYVADAYAQTTWRLANRIGGAAVRRAKRMAARSNGAAPQLPEAVVTRAKVEQAARAAGCDVWCIPTLNTTCPEDLPTVLLLYDLVTAHYPKGMDGGTIVTSLRRAFENTRRATLVATSTDYIRKNDLEGVLGLPASKVRVVRTAYPVDMEPVGKYTSDQAQVCTRRPFLFYPSMNRPYKNIMLLIVSLAILHRKYGRTDLGLVLTSAGIGTTYHEMMVLCDTFDVRHHVTVCNDLDRGEVTYLYERAAATVIPSLYEGIGLQYFEALETGSPVVMSNIPTLVEHAEQMGIPVPTFNPDDPADMARVIHESLEDRDRVRAEQQAAYKATPSRPWTLVASEYLDVFEEAAAMHRGEHKAPAQARVNDGPYRMFLMLQTPYLGGVWIATKDLVRSLARLNRSRRQLDLTLGLCVDQQDVGDLGDDVRIETLNYAILPADRVRKLSHFDRVLPPGDSRRDAPEFSVLANPSAMKADAWMTLVDRFAAPLLPDRPYGVFVYDLIQNYVPQAFPPAFFPMYRDSMMPTVHNAHLVVTTNEVTRNDVVRFIGNAHDAVKIAPVCFEVDHRFRGTEPEEVTLPRRPFVLNVNNGSPHKGIELMVRGHAKLCQKLGSEAPLLVVCGIFTQAYSQRYVNAAVDYDAWKKIRALVPRLGLVEDRDVVFLGHVKDAQLMYLFQNCTAVVNSAKYDNGSFNLIEAHYFGKQAISNRYPAAEWLYERFRVPVRYFDVDDADGLAGAMADAMKATPSDVGAIRRDLTRSELSMHTYAERMYDLLVELGRTGRASGGQPTLPVQELLRRAA